MRVTPPTPSTESHCSTLAFVHGLCGSKRLYPSGLNRTSCVIKLFPDGFHSHPSDCFFFKFTQSLLVQLSKAWHSNQNRAYIELQITLRNKRQKAALSSFATGSMSSPELLWAQVQLPQDSRSCSHGAATAGESVAATWLFKQPTIPQASQGLQRNLAPERLWCPKAVPERAVRFPDTQIILSDQTSKHNSLPERVSYYTCLHTA